MALEVIEWSPVISCLNKQEPTTAAIVIEKFVRPFGSHLIQDKASFLHTDALVTF